jgi:hypothetical protein
MKLQQMKKKSRSFNFSLSELDYNHLHTLSNEHKMKPAEYLRTLIQVTWVASNSNPKNFLDNGTLEIGGYGITFPPEFLQEFAQTLEQTFKKFDWNELEDKITITPGQRNYRPK